MRGLCGRGQEHHTQHSALLLLTHSPHHPLLPATAIPLHTQASTSFSSSCRCCPRRLTAMVVVAVCGWCVSATSTPPLGPCPVQSWRSCSKRPTKGWPAWQPTSSTQLQQPPLQEQPLHTPRSRLCTHHSSPCEMLGLVWQIVTLRVCLCRIVRLVVVPLLVAEQPG